MLLRSSDGLSVTAPVDGDRRVPCPGTPDCLFVQGRLHFWCKNYRILRVEGERPERREAQWRVTPRGGEHAVIGTLVNCLDDRCAERAFMGDTSARRCLWVPTAATRPAGATTELVARRWTESGSRASAGRSAEHNAVVARCPQPRSVIALCRGGWLGTQTSSCAVARTVDAVRRSVDVPPARGGEEARPLE